MNTKDENQDTVHNSAYNPFPQPQTIPSGWDTSVFLSASQSSTSVDLSAESDSDTQVDK
jgi:hypothetical protein